VLGNYRVAPVYFAFDTEQEQLRDAIRRFCELRSPESEVRRLADEPRSYDPAVWRQATEQLGLAAIAIPEQFGGAGYGIVELGIAAEEAGRSLLSSPLLSTSLAANFLLATGDIPACERYLPAIADGTSIATIALRELADGHRGPEFHGGTDDARVTGSCEWVADADSADVLVLIADAGSSKVPVVIDLHADGITLDRLPSVDITRRHFTVSFDATPADVIDTDAGAPADRTYDVARVLVATEQLGIAQRALDMATEYGKVREQFGRPIGSFQAIKHTLATVLLEVEATRSAVWFGLWAAQNDPAQLPLASRIAGTTSGDCALLANAENIQVHGGIGMTWEHPAHLYYKRALVNRQFLGDPQQQRAEIAARII
jgi:alkylation response protein AidB-like acyl-CoA dehydrogenase